MSHLASQTVAGLQHEVDAPAAGWLEPKAKERLPVLQLAFVQQAKFASNIGIEKA